MFRYYFLVPNIFEIPSSALAGLRFLPYPSQAVPTRTPDARTRTKTAGAVCLGCSIYR